MADNLDNQLENATKRFVNDKSKNIITPTEINISHIFEWYAADFDMHGSIINFLNKYSKIKINTNAKITYLDYNWSLND